MPARRCAFSQTRVYEKPEHEFVRRCVTEAGAFSESVLESVFSISCPRNEFREFRKRLTVLCDPFSEATPGYPLQRRIDRSVKVASTVRRSASLLAHTTCVLRIALQFHTC